MFSIYVLNIPIPKIGDYGIYSSYALSQEEIAVIDSQQNQAEYFAISPKHINFVPKKRGQSQKIGVALDEWRNRQLLNPDALLDFIDARVHKDGKTHYVI